VRDCRQRLCGARWGHAAGARLARLPVADSPPGI
jgi:hypothetical protein